MAAAMAVRWRRSSDRRSNAQQRAPVKPDPRRAFMLGYATVLIAGTYFVAAYFLKLPQNDPGIREMARRRLPASIGRFLP